MIPNPVGWFEIYVDDMERAKQFYQTVFAVELAQLPSPDSEVDIEMWSFAADMEQYGASGVLAKIAGHNSVLVYFSCEDCSLEESRIESAGGKVEASKYPIGEHGFITMAIDSEGNKFGLHSMK